MRMNAALCMVNLLVFVMPMIAKEPDKMPQPIGLTVNNNNEHAITVKNNHEIKLVTPDSDVYDCTKCSCLQVLKERMNILPKEYLLKNLLALDSRPRMAYCQSLSGNEARALYNDIQSFTQEDRKKIVATAGGQEFIDCLEKKVAVRFLLLIPFYNYIPLGPFGGIKIVR